MDEQLKAKEARLKEKLERVEKMLPDFKGSQKAQIEASIERTKSQLSELRKAIGKEKPK